MQDIFRNKSTGINYIDISKYPVSKKKSQKLSVISLFSGAGGLDIGLEDAGFQTKVCVEIDDDCRETLKFNRPEWKLFEENDNRLAGDIRKISADELLSLANAKEKEIDLVVGGAPCQPFSNIGKKLGKDDPNNGDLFLEYVRIIKGVMPKAFIFENVVGITHKKHSQVIDYMKEQFNGLGYGLSFSVLNSADYGVAQKRSRFFMIGIQGIETPAFPLPTFTKNSQGWEKFIDTLDRVPHLRPKKWMSVSDTFSQLEKDYQLRNDFAQMNCSNIVTERMKHIKQGENFKVLPMDMRPQCWQSGKHQGHDTFGRLKSDEPSVTIRTAAYNPSKGRYIHPDEDRGLNTIELASLQSFPKEWVFKSKGRDKITLVSGGKQIGNAVPPLLAKALGSAIYAQIKG